MLFDVFQYTFLHLGLRIAIGYWSLNLLDKIECQQQYIPIITYISYFIILLNLLSYFLTRNHNINQTIGYIFLVLNSMATLAVLYLSMDVYSRENQCAGNKAVSLFFFIQALIAALLQIAFMVTEQIRVRQFVNWVGNAAWIVLFLKSGFVEDFRIYAIIIGVIYVVILASSIAAIYWAYHKLEWNVLKAQWYIAVGIATMALLLSLKQLADSSRDGSYEYLYNRKIFAIFAGVNALDIGVWIYHFHQLTIF